jgi:stringent starvation protein B
MGNEPRRPRGADADADPQSRDARLSRSRAKRELFTKLLLEQGSVAIRLDARRPGVVVPETFAEEQSLTLDIWWKPPDAPMKLNERGIAATLRFDGERFRCLIPWTAVWGVRTARLGALHAWEVDMPVELGGVPLTEPLDEEPVEPRPRLVHALPTRELTPAPAAAAPAPEATEPPQEPPRPSHLRLVK